MHFENVFLGPRSIQVCHLRSKTPLPSVDCLRGPPRPIQPGRWSPRVLGWPAGSARGGVGGRRDEQGPTPDSAGPSLPTPSPSPTATYRRSRGPGRALLGSAPLKLRGGDGELRRPPSSSLLRRALLRPRMPRGHAAIPCSLRRARRGPAPPASSGRWASSSPGVGSARLGADPSGSQSSGGTARSFLPLFCLPCARPWRRAERWRRPAMRRAMAASCCARWPWHLDLPSTSGEAAREASGGRDGARMAYVGVWRASRPGAGRVTAARRRPDGGWWRRAELQRRKLCTTRPRAG